MKKRYIWLAGLLAFCIAAAGCGSKDDGSSQQAEVTVVPTETPEEDLVDMQVVEDDEEEETNIIGEKTETSSELTIVNETGGEVKAIYIRPNEEYSDDWGEELIDGSFTLKDGDEAHYYYEKDAKDEDGNVVTLYDIRITYSEVGKNECFFRKLPLTEMSKITLCMDGEGEAGIPYAKYFSTSSKKEVSTLEEVKQRLGLSSGTSDDEDSQETEDDLTGVTPTPTEVPSNEIETPAPEPTEAPSEGDSQLIEQAKGCIGQSLDALYSACGSPNGSDYVDEPESGKTGYYYYDTFTVSTTVDENGNEVVAGVW